MLVCGSIFESRKTLQACADAYRTLPLSLRQMTPHSVPFGPSKQRMRATGESIHKPPAGVRAHARVAAAAPSSAISHPQENYADRSETLSLNNIRRSLILMEDTIIFSLIERAQFRRNEPIYRPGAVPVPMFSREGQQFSLLQYLLRETEQIHGRIRRYTNPDENAFFPEDLPPLILPPLSYPQVLWPPAAGVSVNSKIMDMYLDSLLPEIALPGDDANYGSAAMYDVMILQALSRRIHYGKFVAEAKFMKQTAEYTELIRARDADGIMRLLTDRAVELRVIDRVKLKAATFGRDLNSAAESAEGNGTGPMRISPQSVAELYDAWVMPLTKEVEVEYLLRRLDELDS